MYVISSMWIPSAAGRHHHKINIILMRPVQPYVYNYQTYAFHPTIEIKLYTDEKGIKLHHVHCHWHCITLF